MKAHYTRFETEKQFNELAEKAGHLGDVSNYCKGETFFGFDRLDGCYASYDLIGYDVLGYYQSATYLPYTEYLEYLDKCIEKSKK